MVGPRKRQRQRIVMVDDERWEAAGERAEERGVSRSEMVRRGFDAYAILEAVRRGDLEEAKRLSDELEKT